MTINRELVLCTLKAFVESRNEQGIVSTLPECLDAFAASGVMGLVWKRHLGAGVRVVVNDVKEAAVEAARANCARNGFAAENHEPGLRPPPPVADGLASSGAVLLAALDANVLLHQTSFDFVHLDPFGSAANYLLAACRHLRNGGLLSVTSTDPSTLHANYPQVALRTYGGAVHKTEYSRELAARLVLAAVVRAAALCSKGVKVLMTCSVSHMSLVVCQLVRGSPAADACVAQLQHVYHCTTCSARQFVSMKECFAVSSPCACGSSVVLGPVWSGNIMNSTFIGRVNKAASDVGIRAKTKELLQTILCESRAPRGPPGSGTDVQKPDADGAAAPPDAAKRPCEEPESAGKKQRTAAPPGGEEASAVGETLSKGEAPDVSERTPPKNAVSYKSKDDVNPGDPVGSCPSFYFLVHKHSNPKAGPPRVRDVVAALQRAGHAASKTHLDPQGVRTDAPLQEFERICKQLSKS